jgi:adiponectin receptor
MFLSRSFSETSENHEDILSTIDLSISTTQDNHDDNKQDVNIEIISRNVTKKIPQQNPNNFVNLFDQNSNNISQDTIRDDFYSQTPQTAANSRLHTSSTDDAIVTSPGTPVNRQKALNQPNSPHFSPIPTALRPPQLRPNSSNSLPQPKTPHQNGSSPVESIFGLKLTQSASKQQEESYLHQFYEYFNDISGLGVTGAFESIWDSTQNRISKGLGFFNDDSAVFSQDKSPQINSKNLKNLDKLSTKNSNKITKMRNTTQFAAVDVSSAVSVHNLSSSTYIVDSPLYARDDVQMKRSANNLNIFEKSPKDDENGSKHQEKRRSVHFDDFDHQRYQRYQKYQKYDKNDTNTHQNSEISSIISSISSLTNTPTQIPSLNSQTDRLNDTALYQTSPFGDGVGPLTTQHSQNPNPKQQNQNNTSQNSFNSRHNYPDHSHNSNNNNKNNNSNSNNGSNNTNNNGPRNNNNNDNPHTHHNFDDSISYQSQYSSASTYATTLMSLRHFGAFIGWREFVPPWADVPYINVGYRINHTHKDCVHSLLSLHNETCNVWTHILGIIIFSFLFVYRYNTILFALLDENSIHHNPFFFWTSVAYYAGTITCMVLSTFYHLFGCIDEETHVWLYRKDMTGVILMILGNFVMPVVVTFHCNIGVAQLYVIGALLLSIPLVLMQNLDYFQQKSWYVLRISLLIGFSGLVFVPYCHYFIIGNVQRAIDLSFVIFISILFYILGLLFWVFKFPEAYFNQIGNLSIWDCQVFSHGLWHVCIILASLWTEQGFALETSKIFDGLSPCPY